MLSLKLDDKESLKECLLKIYFPDRICRKMYEMQWNRADVDKSKTSCVKGCTIR